MHAVVTGTGIEIKNKASRTCCAPEPSIFVPFYNVLNATPTANGVRLMYIQPQRPHKLESVVCELKPPTEYEALNRSPEAPLSTGDTSNLFGDAPILRKNLFVLINPHGGTQKADMLFRTFCKPIFDAAGAKCDITYTTRHGEAREIAASQDLSGYDAIVCVSGDGIPHEVINGLMSRKDELAQKIPVCQLPGGSGNAMSHSATGGDNFGLCSLNVLKGQLTRADLMYITQGTSSSYSFLSQSFGIVADCDLGTEEFRWMGAARFTLGVIYKTLRSTKYPCKLAYKRQGPASVVPQYGTVEDPLPEDWSVEVHPELSMFYVGKMPYMSADALVFPHAKPADSQMDLLLWDVSVGTIAGLQLLDKMQRGEHVNDRKARYEKVVAYRLIPECDAYLSVDGEAYECSPIQVEILTQAALTVTPQGEYSHVTV